MLASARVFYGACPLCHSKAGIDEVFVDADCTLHPLYSAALPRTMSWKRCATCTHVFTDGYFTDEALAVVFGKTNQNQKVGHDIEGQRMVSARIVERVLPFQHKGNWLDIGFGNGSLLFTADEFGFSCAGVELRRDNVAQLNAMGIEAHCIDIEILDQPGRYSVISMCDVLEHMPYPVPALKAVHRLLKDDGVLFLSMPNMDSVVWNAMNGASTNPYWGELEHYHNFGRRRLFELLRENGLEPVKFGLSERYRACMEVVAEKV